MRVLIIGYGSMGRRRIRLLSELVQELEIICVDSSQDRQQQAKAAGIETYGSLYEALHAKPQTAFVCTSPGHHAEIILQLVNAGIHVFTELNLTDEYYDSIMELARKKNITVFMSSTMLYKKQIEIIQDFVKKQTRPLMYIYHVGQYLPDWHPWESYRDFFIGKKETNGVREILAVQLPWIVETFGKVRNVYADRQRCTGLDIEFYDSVAVNLKHENGNIGMIAADVVSRKAVTRLEVIGEKMHIFWDGHNDDLFVLDTDSGEFKQIRAYESVDHAEGYADNIAENPYKDEIRDFLEILENGKSARYSLEKDAYILSLIDKIEEEKG